MKNIFIHDKADTMKEEFKKMYKYFIFPSLYVNKNVFNQKEKEEI